MGTITINGTGGIIEGNLGTAAVDVNLDAPYTFDGTNDFFYVADHNDFDLSATLTMSAWIKPTGSGEDWQIIMTKNGVDGDADRAYAFWYKTDGRLYMFLGDDSSNTNMNTDAGVVVSGVWSHVAATFDNSSNTGKIYVNGVLKATNTSMTTSPYNTGKRFTIGAVNDNDGGSSAAEFQGEMADVKLFSDVLTDAEVQEISSKINYDISTGSIGNLVAWYKLMGAVADSSGNSHNLTAVGSPAQDYDAFSVNVQDSGTATTSGNFTITQGKLECKSLSCVDLDGSAEYIYIGDNNGLSFGDGSDDSPFTISAWIKADANNFPIISKGHYNSGVGEYAFYINSSGYLALELWDESVASCYIGQRYETAITLNQWIHVAATYSAPAGGGAGATDGVKLYIDGVLVSSSDYEGNEGSYDAMENLGSNAWIGRLDNTYANGEIRDVRIYNYELSADQASSLYSGSYNVTPYLWWKIDEGHTTETDVDASNAFTDTGTKGDLGTNQFNRLDGTGTNLDANSCQNGTLDLNEESSILTIGTDGDSVVKGTFSAPRGTLLTQQDFKNFGSYIHNNGTIEFDGNGSTDINEDSNCVDTTFYNVKHSSPSDDELTFRMHTNFTIEGTLTNAGTDGDIRFANYSADKTVTFGTQTSAGGIVNSSSNSSTIEFSGNTTYQTTFQAANSLYPFTVTGTDFDWDSGGSGSKVKLSGVDYAPVVTTGGSGVTITLEGDCKFDDITISAGDKLDVNGKRLECVDWTQTGGGSPSLLDIEDSLCVISGHVDWNGIIPTANTGTKLIHSTSAEKNWRSNYTGDGTFMCTGSQTTMTGYQWASGSDQLDNVIVGSGTFNSNSLNNTTDNVTIASGGIYTGGGTTITCAGDFTMTGGLLGASALRFDGSNDTVTIPISASQNDHIKGAFADGIFTVEGWIKMPTDFSNSVWFHKNTEFSVNIARDSATEWALADGASWNFGANTFTIPNSLEDDKWHHLAFSRRNEAGNQGYYDIYIDGKLVVTHKVASAGLWSANDDDVNIGSYNGVSSFLGGGADDTFVENIRIWGTARTATQIRADMFNSTPTSSASDCIANFTFNEGTGTEITASDPNSASSNETAGTWNGDWAAAGSLTWTGGSTPSAGTLVMSGGSAKTMTIPANQKFFNLTSSGAGALTISDTPYIYGLLASSGANIVRAGQLGINGTTTPTVSGTTFGNIDTFVYQAGSGNTTTATATTYKTLRPSNSTPVLLGGVTTATGVQLDGGTSLTTQGHNLTTKTVSNSGTLTLSADTTLTFSDLSGSGFGSSSGALVSAGTSGNPNTITASGTPTNYWNFHDHAMNLTADHTTFEKFHRYESGSATVDIDNCTMQTSVSGYYNWTIEAGATITSFTNNTINVTGNYGFQCNKTHRAFDNITVSSSGDYSVISTGGTLEFTNSNFSIGNVRLSSSSSHLISKTHNDTANLYEICAGSGGLTYSTISNTPDIPTAVIKQRTGILTFNSDNKEFDSYNVFSGATIRVTDGKDMYLNTFDNDGTWVQTAGYGGEIHVGDFTPFDSGDVIDDTDFVDTGFHDTSHYLEMDL